MVMNTTHIHDPLYPLTDFRRPLTPFSHSKLLPLNPSPPLFR